MIIGVDIDGVLTTETKGHLYKYRIPNNLMIDKVNQWFMEGHRIVLYSARWESDREITKKWLKKYKVYYHDLVLDKPKFDLYIGDEVKRPEEVCGES